MKTKVALMSLRTTYQSLESLIQDIDTAEENNEQAPDGEQVEEYSTATRAAIRAAYQVLTCRMMDMDPKFEHDFLWGPIYDRLDRHWCQAVDRSMAKVSRASIYLALHFTSPRKVLDAYIDQVMAGKGWFKGGNNYFDPNLN